MSPQHSRTDTHWLSLVFSRLGRDAGSMPTSEGKEKCTHSEASRETKGVGQMR